MSEKGTDHNGATYGERQENINKGEELFVAYMNNKGYKIHRFGFDEKRSNVEGFYLMHPVLRSLPDYVSYSKRESKLYYFHVKGTNKVKIEDLISYSTFESLFCDEKSVLRIAFCFEGQAIRFKSLNEIKKMMTGKAISEWHDKKQFIALKFD